MITEVQFSTLVCEQIGAINISWNFDYFDMIALQRLLYPQLFNGHVLDLSTPMPHYRAL